MNVITRFAPSPTGLIHIGNVRTALISFLFTKSQGGKFMLRIDDTDTERSKEEYTTQIQKDLKWVGLKWDLFAKQSERIERYEQVKKMLIEQGRLYPCYETAEEIEMKRKMLLGRGLPPIYDRAALKLTDQQKKKYEEDGISPHWRFKLDHDSDIVWQDLIKGEIRFEANKLSDPVLIRGNGIPTYMLPSAIDDIDFDISHIVRGEDHVSNTAIQIQIFEAISNKLPQFAHHSLMKGKDGKISKREGGFDVTSLRESGVEPMAIISFLAKLGTSDPIEIKKNIDEVIKEFDINKFSKVAAIYDPEDLSRINAKVIHNLEYEEVSARDELKNIDKDFWDSVKPNISTISEVNEWVEICYQELSPVIKDLEYTKTASGLLPEGTWDENTWNEWITNIKDKTGRKGKDLFMPIRLALTAKDNGPELKYILPLIGSEKAHARLNGNKA